MNADEIDMDEIYTDQAFSGFGFGITCAYTQYGIRNIDNIFCRRIQAYGRGEAHAEYSYDYSTKPPTKEVEQEWTDTHKSILDDINKNPHLHPIIKENLILNLDRCREEIKCLKGIQK